MIDVHTAEQRRRNMSAIRHKNTKPEILVRSELHKRGFRFRVHRKDLPGNPDIVLPKYNAVILVNGCFWHGHECDLFKWPKTREEFWREKISSNVLRDSNNIRTLCAMGYRVLIIWECATKGPKKLESKFLFDQVTQWVKSASHRKEISGELSSH